jgi:hypothetical protein
MNLGPSPQMEATGNNIASAKRWYWPPAYKKLGLADVLKLLESNPSNHEQEFRLLLEQRGSR